jgi:hypothetical protein
MNTETLNQGLKFKKIQKQFIEPKKKSSISTIFEGFGNLENDYTENTRTLLSKNPAADQSVYQELQDLQTHFNSLLTRYQSAESRVMSETQHFVNSQDPNVNKNVVVTSIVENPASQYLGSFNDNSSTPAMTPVLNSDGTVNAMSYSDCLNQAISTGNAYFGLENMGGYGSTGTAQCSLSNNLEQAQQYGETVPLCTTGADGNTYAGAGTNAIYNTNGSSYIGCYKDNSSSPAMTQNGPGAVPMNPVYIAGQYGCSPWGYGGGFPDNNANWIWYSENAANGAVTNTGSPITLMYNYQFSGPGYVNATLTAACDNLATIYFNGNEIGQANATDGPTWSGPGFSFPIQFAPNTPNYITVAVVNQGGPAGFILTCQDSNGTVLFNTDNTWQWTTVPANILVPGGQNFSVSTCQQFAQAAGYPYFAVQNGGDGTSQCFVSNNLANATQYGVQVQTTTGSDGQTYGAQNVNAVYNVTTQGYPQYMNSIGYVNLDGTLSYYPSMDVFNELTANGASCPTEMTNITSVEWNNYPKAGDMTPSSLCGLASDIDSNVSAAEDIERQLEAVTAKILEKIRYLERLDGDVIQQLGINKDYLDKMTTEFTKVYGKFKTYKGKQEQKAVDNILADSVTVVDSHNYSYILWSVIAIVILIISVVLIRKTMSG